MLAPPEVGSPSELKRRYGKATLQDLFVGLVARESDDRQS